jgi:NAD-dependent DNA ligase
MNELLLLFDSWTFEIEDIFIEFKYSDEVFRRIDNINRKNIGDGTIIIVKRMNEENNFIYGIEKTSRESIKRVKEWKDRILILTIKTSCVDLMEKLLHLLFNDFRIKRKNQIDGHYEIEWFDFKKENQFHSFITNIKIIKKITKYLNRKTKKKIKNVEKLNINKANLDDLLSLAGIGKVLAQRIFKYKPYKNANDLKQLKGINDGVLGKIERFICFE